MRLDNGIPITWLRAPCAIIRELTCPALDQVSVSVQYFSLPARRLVEHYGGG